MLWILLSSGSSLTLPGMIFLLLSYAALVLVMLPAHECAHAAVANWLGDPTARWQGRLTMNPRAHLDLIGTLMLVLVGFGYAKPVPVNPNNFRKVPPKTGMALTALAGPASNLLMALIALVIFKIITVVDGGVEVVNSTIYYYHELSLYAYIVLVEAFASVNIGLAVFNLLPIPPLDGSRIFSAILPDKWVFAMERYSRVIMLVIFALLITGALDVPLDYLRHGIGWLLCTILGLPNYF